MTSCAVSCQKNGDANFMGCHHFHDFPCRPRKAELQLDGPLLPIPNFRQEAGPVESLARRVVIEEVRSARNAIADEPRSTLGAIEESLGRDDQPVLAGVEAIEPAAFL